MGKERWIQSKVTSLPPPPLAFLHLGLGEVVFPPLWAGRHFYAPLYLSVPPQSWALGPVSGSSAQNAVLLGNGLPPFLAPVDLGGAR